MIRAPIIVCLVAAAALGGARCGEANPRAPVVAADTTRLVAGDSAGVVGPDGACVLRLSRRGWDAFSRLLQDTSFDDEIAGDSTDRWLSDGARAFRTLFREEDRDAAFRCLAVRGETVAQLYGMCGLYFLDSATFETLAPRYRGRRDSVWRQTNEHLWLDEIAEIFHRRGRRVLLPDRRGNVRAAWMAEGEHRIDSSDAFTDIDGGGIPSELKDGVVFRAEDRGDGDR